MRQRNLLFTIASIVVCISILARLCEGGLVLPLKAGRTHTLTTSMGKHPKARAAGLPWRIPLQGNLTFWGEYFTTIGIGTPPQYVQLQVDTGSVDLIVYAKDCDGCGNPVHYYDPFSSSTCNQIECDNDQYQCMQSDTCDMDPCQWEDQFGDGSTIDGVVVTDVVTIGSVKSPNPYSLGPINSVDAPNGFEATGVDGIWGFAYQDLSGWGGEPVIQELMNDLKLYNSFDMCLLENGGVLAIGDDYSKDSRFQWTAITEDQWYTVYMEDWKMGGVSLGLAAWRLNWNGVIVDSGTTLLIVDTQIFTAIKTMLTNNCTNNPLLGVCNVPAGQGLFDGKCFKMADSDVKKFPDLAISFTNTTALSITAFDYLWQGTGVPGEYCLGIQVYDDLPVIIGDVFMQNFHVVFDRNLDKVGFGPLSSCPSSTDFHPNLSLNE